MKRGLLRMAALALTVVSAVSAHAQTWTGNTVQAGSFYLYNVGTGMYLTGGNNWGTHASLSAAGSEMVLAASGGGFTLDSGFSNGGDNHYVAGAFIDGNATPWVFTGSASGYTLKNESTGQFLCATGEGTYVDVRDNADDDNGKWILVSRADFLNAMASATTSNPIDVSSLIQCADLNRNDSRSSAWTIERNGGNFTLNGPDGNRTSYGCESWNNTFDLYQVLINMPVGTYELTVDGYGTNGTTKIYINDTEADFVNTSSASNFGTALDQIAAGQHKGNTTGKVLVTDTSLRIGVKRTTNVGADWTVLDNFRLIYYGSQVDLNALKAALDSKVGEVRTSVNALSALGLNVATTLNTTLDNIVSATYADAASISNASKQVTQIDLDAKALAAAAQPVKDLIDELATAQSLLGTNIDVTAINASYAAATTTNAFAQVITDTRAAAFAALQSTSLSASESKSVAIGNLVIVNPYPYASSEGWTVLNADGELATVNALDPVNRNSEFWNQRGYSLSQVISGLPAGSYTLKCIAYTRSAGSYNNTTNLDDMTAILRAGSASMEIAHANPAEVNSRQQGNAWFNANNGINTLSFNVVEGQDVTISLTADNDAAHWDWWTVWRGFELFYHGAAAADDVIADLVAQGSTLQTETMGAEVLNNLTSAILAAQNVNTADREATNAALLALNTAIENAQKSINAYAAIPAAIKAYKDNNPDLDLTELDNMFAAKQFNYLEDVAAAFQHIFFSTLGMQDGADWTSLIMNATPTSNSNGWSGDKSNAYDPGNNVAEFWNMSGAYMSQTIKNLPEGTYVLTVKAFTRDGMTATLSANNSSVNLVTIPSSVANNRTQANAWFEAGNGENMLTFNIIGNPQDVTITLRADNTTGDHWLVWRNFTLSYYTLKELKLENTPEPTIALADGTVINDGGTYNANAAKMARGIVLSFPGAVIKNCDIHPTSYVAFGTIVNTTDGIMYKVRSLGTWNNGFNPNFDINFGRGLFGWGNASLAEYLGYAPDEISKAKVNDVVIEDVQIQWFEQFGDMYDYDNYIKPRWQQDYATRHNGTIPALIAKTYEELLEQQRQYDGFNPGDAYFDGTTITYPTANPYIPLTSDEADYVDFCNKHFDDPVVMWEAAKVGDYVSHFTVNTDASVKQDVDKISMNQTVTAWDVRGNEITDLLFETSVQTSIEGIQAAGKDGVIYNLSGQRVQTARQGIFVVNGKKVVLK